MAYWLLKTEPGDYSYADLESDGETVWTGVRNNLAQKYMRQIKAGDTALIYHTGKERAVVGLAKVTKPPYADPEDDKYVVFDIAPKQALKQPVTLAEIKADPAFADWDLTRLSRLSVVPTQKKHLDRVLELSKQKR